MNSVGACDECRNADNQNDIPETVSNIGDRVVIRTAVGRGHDQTEHIFGQCSTCGSVWVTYIDSGAGGHGRFHRRLTRDLF